MTPPTNTWLTNWLTWGRRRVRGERYGLRTRPALVVVQLEDRLVPTFLGGVAVATGDVNGDGYVDIVTAAGPGGGPHVKVFSGETGQEIAGFFAYDPAMAAGVNVAVGDVTGDGRADIVTAAGPGGGPHVKVFDGATLTEVRSFFAFDPGFQGGVTVAVGDVDGDGVAEVVAGTQTGGSEVRVFAHAGDVPVTVFTAYSPEFAGGTWVATTDADGDGRAEVVTGAGRGGAAHVKVSDGTTGRERFGFYAYESAFTGGALVAGGDVDGDGFGDVVVGAGADGGPRVRAFSGRDGAQIPTPVGNFFAYAPDFRGGVHVAAADLDGDGRADVITGAGAGGTAHVRVFRSPTAADLASFIAYDPVATGGAFARPAASNNPPTISAIPDRTVLSNQTTGPVGFTVGDPETPASALTLSVVTSNPALIPASRLLLGGSGSNRTIEARPADDLSGEAVVTVTVTDGQGATASSSFRVTVVAVPGNRPPTISAFPDLRLEAGMSSGPIPFTVDDEETAADMLVLGVTSDNPGLVAESNVTFGGGGNDRTLTVTLVGSGVGEASLVVAVRDEGGGVASTVLRLTVVESSDPRPNTPPTVSAFPDLRLEPGMSSGPIPFTVDDAETAADMLDVTVTSDNPSVVPEARITLGGSGRDRTLTLAAAEGLSGEASIVVTVRDAAGAVASDAFVVTVAPAGGDPLPVRFDLAAGFDSAPRGDSVTAFTSVAITGETSPGATVTVAGRDAVAGADGTFVVFGVPLELGDNVVVVTAMLGGRTGTASGTVRRVPPPPGTVVLREGAGVVAEQAVGVATGPVTGRRVVRFSVEAGFDGSDRGTQSPDTFAVYLVDPADRTRTLLDRGRPGTSLLALGGLMPESVAGLVRYDGGVVEIDTTSLTTPGGAELLFQLLSTDGDGGTEVHVGPVETVGDPLATAGGRVSASPVSLVPGAAVDLAELDPVTGLSLSVGNVRFDSAAGRYVAELRARNTGGATGRQLVAVFDGLPPGVTLPTASGTTADGRPYVSFAGAIPVGGLGENDLSDPVEVVVSDPTLVRFELAPVFLSGQPNRTPVLAPVAPVTVLPGGRVDIQLQATDPDGDRVSYRVTSDRPLPPSELTADHRLVLSPGPAHVGTYQVLVTATDGFASATQTFTLTVEPDPVTTTRISGTVLDVDGAPLVGVPIGLGSSETLTLSDGSFTVERPDVADPSTPLEIHGERLAGGRRFPFVAEKLPLLLGRAVYPGANNVIARPIYLPALDPGTFVDPAVDQVIRATSIPGASVAFSAGTLHTQTGAPFQGELSITEVPINFTPAALPARLRPDIVVTIQPGEMVFTQPASLTLPNLAGFATGTIFDLWSINPTTGEFDDVGDGEAVEVDDGAGGTRSVILTRSGGVRNSSWHFFSARGPQPNGGGDFNPNNQCEECKAEGDTNSVVELHSGALHEWHDTAAYQSLGASRGVTLHYDSERADARPIVHFGYDDTGSSVPDLRMVASLSYSLGPTELYRLAGAEGGGQGTPLQPGDHVWTIPDGAKGADAALQLDLRDVSSRVVPYTVATRVGRVANGLLGTDDLTTGSILHVNTVDSPYGSGWGIGGLQHLVRAGTLDGWILVDGDGGESLYTAALDPVPGGPAVYDSPPGDFSRLVPEVGATPVATKYRREMTDGTVYTFGYHPSALGEYALESVVDRNGNATRYSYRGFGGSGELLVRVVDAVGLETTLDYDTNGKLASITDPAGRVTLVRVDAAGNLRGVTDPDGAAREWGYDTRHHMRTETDQRGNREESFYDFAGRATGALRKDGTTVRVQPVQTRGLLPPGATTSLASPPAAAQLGRAARSTYTDGNGTVTNYVLDRAGQTILSSDIQGPMGTVTRDGENQVTRSVDGRGFVAAYEYDDRGNVTQYFPPGATPEGFLAFYTFDGDARDATGNGNDGVVNGPELAAGYQGLGYRFNGAGDFIRIPVDINPAVHPQLTMGAWVKVSQANPTRQVISHDNGGFDRSLGIDSRGGGAGWSAFAGGSQVIGHVPVELEAWTFVAVVYDQPAATVTLYVDDEIIRGTGTVGGGEGATRIGSNPGFGEFFSGVIDNVFILDRALSDAEVARLRDRGAAALVSSENPRQYTYDPTFSRVTSATDELGHRTLYDIDPANGNVRSMTEVVGELDSAANGKADDLVTAYTYNARGQIDTMANPRGFVTDYDYDDLGRVTKATFAKGTPDEAVEQYEYDGAGNRTALVTFIDGRPRRTVYEFDSMNRLKKVTEPDPDGAGPLASPVSNYTYDKSGNLVTATDALNHVTTYGYDARDRQARVTMPDPDGTGPLVSPVERMSYDEQGNVVARTDPNGNVTQYRYDTRNRRIATIDPDGGVTRFAYDTTDNLTSLTDPGGNVTAFGYDARNRQVTETDPLGKVIRYEYDAADNLLRKTDRNGRVTEYAYDDLDRLLTETWVGGNVVIAYAYDKNGNLSAAADPFSTLAYRYDARDRMAVADNTGTPDTPAVVLTYRYDDANNVLSVTDAIGGAAGAATVYSYDDLDRLTSERQSGTNTAAKRVDFAYNVLGQYTAMTRFADLAGTQLVASTAYAYDGMNRLLSITHGPAANPVSFFNYTYDAGSRITRIVSPDGTADYGYDDRDELTGVAYTNPALPDELYRYDENGNRTESHLHGTGYDTEPNTANRLKSDGTYTYEYDDEGNTTRRVRTDGQTDANGSTIREFAWDYRNRLTRVTDTTAGGIVVQEVTFAYDALNRRIAKTVGGASTLFVYDREDVLFDFAGTALGVRYFHGPGIDQVLAQEKAGTGTQWLLTDHLGSTRAVVGGGGAVQLMNYDAYGNPVGTLPTRFGFTGREWDVETKLHYNRARYYSADVGQFLSIDPLGTDAGNNIYSYVYNSPLKLTDPYGLCGCDQANAETTMVVMGVCAFIPFPGSAACGAGAIGGYFINKQLCKSYQNPNSGPATPATPATPAPQPPRIPPKKVPLDEELERILRGD